MMMADRRQEGRDKQKLHGYMVTRFHSYTVPLRIMLLLGLVALCGCCATSRQIQSRHFDFQKDTFAFANGLKWVYEYDSRGKWTTHDRVPRPDYWQHCFVIARATKQFFTNARFDAALPEADEDTYRNLIKQV